MKNTKVSFALAAAMVLGSLGFVPRALAAAHPAGTNVSNNGTVYMITDDGQRRPYTSAGAFLSYGFNAWATVAPATPEDMALPEGSFIPPRDGKIVCSDRGADKGTCYLITAGKRAAFVSEGVFKGLGFSFAKALYGDVSFLEKDSDIVNSSDQHRAGVLINRGGTIYLISNGSVLGIPDPGVLGSWGYSLDDAVPAVAADSSFSQTSVISVRQGARLKPDEDTQSTLSEDVIFRGYLDTHPALPTVEISSPTSASAVLDLKTRSDSMTFKEMYPYMTAKTMEMLNKTPEFKADMERSGTSAFLAGTTEIYSKVTVYQGDAVALYASTEKQDYTGYTRPLHMVFAKENGVWKYDFIGTLKYAREQDQKTNPAADAVTGTGTTNVTVQELDYTPDPKNNDKNTWLVVVIKNNGQTTVHRLDITVELNDTGVYSSPFYADVAPNQSILLAIPVQQYWQKPGAPTGDSTIRTDIWVNVDPVNLDTTLSDNTKYINVQFKANTSPTGLNIVQ